MNVLQFIGSIPAMLGLVSAQPQVVSRVTIEQTTIWRIPVRPHPFAPPFDWREKKGPKCIPAAAIAGAMLAGASSIDFVMVDQTRIRARVDDDCSALDFYKGFYVQPADDRLCVKRDEIRSRMGAGCRIERFRLLVPQLRR